MVVMGVAYGTDECRLIWLKTPTGGGSANLCFRHLQCVFLLFAAGIAAVEANLRFARSLQIETQILGGNIARTVVEIARSYQVTQIFVPHLRVDFLQRLRGKNFTEDIVRLAQDLQVTVVAGRSRRPATP